MFAQYGAYRTKPIAEMNDEERRSYFREGQRRRRMKFRLHRNDKIRPLKQHCSSCDVEFPFTEKFFYRSKSSKWGLLKHCRDCERTKAKAYVLSRKYGMPYEEYLARTKGGACAICGVKEKLVMDHCHTTGRVRDVLCSHCNTGIGHFLENPDLLRSAISYVEKHRQISGLGKSCAAAGK